MVRHSTQKILETHTFLHDNSWNMTKLANIAGVPAISLKNYLNGQPCRDIKAIEEKISQVISEHQRPQDLNGQNAGFVETSVSKRINDVANLCRNFREIGVVVSEPGMGKTESVKAYRCQHPETLLVETDYGYTTQVLLNEILRELQEPFGGTIHDMMQTIINKLRDSGRFIIIDEAENLQYKTLELIRRIHDKAKVGILLAGMPRLLSNLRGKNREYAQLFSRVGVAVNAGPLLDADIELLVKKSLPHTNGLWKHFAKESGNNARRLSKLIERAQRIAEINSLAIDEEIIVRAAELLIS